MIHFHYEAADWEGRTHRGRIQADQEKEARAQLRAQGLWVVRLSADPPRTKTRLKPSRTAFMIRQWASLLIAGLTVDQSLEALLGQCEDAKESYLLTMIRDSVRSGETLARALEHHPGVFEPSFCALVSAGESAGRLPLLLERMADHLETRQALRQKIGLALIYPAVVALVAAAVILALLSFVIPQVIEVFAGSRQLLPLPTRILIGLSTTLGEAAPWLLLFAFPSAIAVGWVLRHRVVRERLHPALLRTPIFGRILRQSDTGRVAATLGLLAEAGVPLLTALGISARTARLAPVRDALLRSGEAVREGISLSRALSQESAFPPLVARMAAIGESSGRMGPMLTQAGKQLENEAAHRAVWLAGILEPMTILVMGAVVLSIVLAILLPVIEMNQMLR